jgi:GNAT superfamily N-acetyltransferase
MTDPVIRLATQGDIDVLVEMRRTFTFEDPETSETTSRPEFESECAAFLAEAISGGRWQIWVAELDAQIVAHAYVALIDKVPRPIGENTKIAYLTNVYTRPEFRGQGIGVQLIRRAQAAAREARVELMMVWPADETIDFYKRESFGTRDAPLIWLSDD